MCTVSDDASALTEATASSFGSLRAPSNRFEFLHGSDEFGFEGVTFTADGTFAILDH